LGRERHHGSQERASPASFSSYPEKLVEAMAARRPTATRKKKKKKKKKLLFSSISQMILFRDLLQFSIYISIHFGEELKLSKPTEVC
jgi:hypothetical protein